MEKEIDLMKRYWIVITTFDEVNGKPKGEVILTTDNRDEAKHHEVAAYKNVVRFDAAARRFL